MSDVYRPHLGIATALLLLSTFFGAGPGSAQDVGLEWHGGPGTVPIGEDLGELDLAEGYIWLDAEGTRRLMELTENPVSGTELATITSASQEESWFLVFEWDEIGYVKDDDADELDPEAMLKSIRQGTEQANRERERRGWTTVEIVGWHEAPHYDARTQNLTWAVAGASDGMRTINRNVRLLGRRGVMSVTLVASPEELATAAAEVDGMLGAFSFRPGSRYAEFVAGKDRVAEIGLAALVVGGAGAMAVKSGLLARFWKFLVAGFLALVAGIKRLFSSKREMGSLRDMERRSLG